MSTISTGVAGLEQALARAALSDDRELAAKVREDGRRFVFLLGGLMRMSRLYDPENSAYISPSNDAAAALAGLVELLGAVHIVCVEDQIYINDIRLRVAASEQAVADSFIASLAAHKVGGLSLHRGLRPDQVKHLAMTLARPQATSVHPLQSIRSHLASLTSVEVTGEYRFRVAGEGEKKKRDMGAALGQCDAVIKEALKNLGADRMPNPLPVRRSVIELLEAIRADPNEALASLRRRQAGIAGQQHLVAVSSQAMLLGQALGLSDADLSDLGVAAMLHDVGAITCPDRTGHAAAGARILLRQRGFHEAKVRRLLLVLEHHLPYVQSGERGVARDDIPSLFARIVHIVDDYDVLTASLPGKVPAMVPARALGLMWAAHTYDPDLLALFVQLMGRLPPGSLLELSDGRWAVSVSGGRDRERFTWPVVRIVRCADGTPPTVPETIDLYESRASLRPKRLLDPTAREQRDLQGLVEGALKPRPAPDSSPPA
ncbi:MAG: HD domain-containing phosphohydrolase [Acidobacteriota bacterium]